MTDHGASRRIGMTVMLATPEFFTTARDLGKFSRSMTGHDKGALARTLSSTSVTLMWSRQWQDSEREYGLGWDRLRPSYRLPSHRSCGRGRCLTVAFVIC